MGGEASRPQVAWTAIEANAELVASDGSLAGRVSRVVGDSDADVFTGLAVVPHALAGERLVAAERVVGIWPDRVEVSLAREQIEALPEYEEPPVVRWDAGERSLLRRLFRRS